MDPPARHQQKRYSQECLTPPSRIAEHCDNKECACNTSVWPLHYFTTCLLQYMIAIASTEKAQHGTRVHADELLKQREYRLITPSVQPHLFHRLPGPTPRGTAVQFDLGFLRKINTLVLFAGPWWMQVPVDICGFVPSIYEEYVTTAGITVADAIEKSQEHIVFDIGDQSQMMWWEQKDSETPMRFLAPDDVRCLMTRNLPKPHTTQKGRKEDKRLHWRQTSSGRGRESSMPNITMS